MNDVNKQYADICKEMGHLQFNLEKITKRMQELRAQVVELEELAQKSKDLQAQAAQAAQKVE